MYNSPRARAARALAVFGTLMIFAAMLATFGCEESAQNAPPASGALSKGAPAPDFTLQSLEGETVRLSQFRGKSNVMLHFGTTWCPPCRAQAPRLNELHEKYEPEELVILSVDSGESPDVVRRFVESEGAGYTTLLDFDNAVSAAYGVQYIPLNVLVDKSGRVRGNPSNSIPEEAISALVGR